MKQKLALTDVNFEEEVLKSTLPVLVDFWSSWCPPCKMMEPIIEELETEMAGKIKVCKINVDQNPKTGAAFNITGVPTFILLKDGREIARKVGAHSKQQLLEIIKKARQCQV